MKLDFHKAELKLKTRNSWESIVLGVRIFNHLPAIARTLQESAASKLTVSSAMDAVFVFFEANLDLKSHFLVDPLPRGLRTKFSEQIAATVVDINGGSLKSETISKALKKYRSDEMDKLKSRKTSLRVLK